MLLRILMGAALLGTSGCASIPEDWGRSEVKKQLSAHGRTVPEGDAAARLDMLLSQGLGPQDAVEAALINNPAVRIEYARLGLSAADVYEAGRLSNPVLSWSRLDPDQAGLADQVTFGLATSFTELLLLPARSDLGAADFARARLEVADAILNLAADVEAAWYRLAGATLQARMAGMLAEAAAVSAELSARYFEAGNINRLKLALAQAFAAESKLDALSAEQMRLSARSELNNFLGLGADADWRINAALALPVAEEDALPRLIELAKNSRLDLAAARKAVDIFAAHRHITNNWRWLGEVEIGVETERESDGTRLTGPTLALELPIFNTHADDVTRAEARLLSAQAELDALEIAIANQVGLALAQVQSARAKIATYRDTLLPLRAEIVERTQLHYNYMLTGVFELLRVKQEQFDAFGDYLDAVTDYWLARVALTRAVGTGLPSSSQIATARLDADSLLQPDAPMPAIDHTMPVPSNEEPEPHDHHHGDQP